MTTTRSRSAARRPAAAWLGPSWRYWLTQQGPRPGPWWMQAAWTALFTLAVAAAFTVAGFAVSRAPRERLMDPGAWAYWFGVNLVVTATIAVVIQGLFALLNPWLRDPHIARWQPWQSSLYHAAVPVAGVMIGWPLGVALLGDAVGRYFRWTTDPMAMAGMLGASIVAALVMHQWFTAKARQVVAEREAAEAQLRLLQGQIEPHFLFNTLANVSGLMEVDTPRARRMLDHFVDYLRGSLQGLREPWRSLGDELALVEAYLAVQAVRMEDRLHVSVDVPEALRSVRVPTLAVQPLVENAVRHGLEPSVDGGTVFLAARRDGDDLVVTVEDDGAGLATARAADGLPQPATPDGGHALRNLRARLATLDGGPGRLSVEPRRPRGVRVELRLPAGPPPDAPPAG